MILVGDIGGTNTRLALYSSDEKYTLIEQKKFPSGKYDSLEAIIKIFLQESSHQQDIHQACFGVAGPVAQGKSKLTNLHWPEINEKSMMTSLRLKKVWLINDLEANAYGTFVLKEEDYLVIKEGEAQAGNAAIIAAGTGLGEAGLYWNGVDHKPFPTEGGHTSFSPQSDLQIGLLLYLRKKFSSVSWENVLSGPGIYPIYCFIQDAQNLDFSQDIQNRLSQEKEKAALITQAALNKTCPRCEKTIELFVELYGIEAGNLALKMMAVNGLWIGGGIAPKILSCLNSDTFRSYFAAKGAMKHLMEKIPVKVILNEDTSLLGAAYYINKNA